MGQLFHPSMNALAKASIFGALFIVGVVGWIAWQVNRSPYVTGAGAARDQPVPFSHEHHVSGLGIDCRTCRRTATQFGDHLTVGVSKAGRTPRIRQGLNSTGIKSYALEYIAYQRVAARQALAGNVASRQQRAPALIEEPQYMATCGNRRRNNKWFRSEDV